jgi:hypothetical protein
MSAYKSNEHTCVMLNMSVSYNTTMLQYYNNIIPSYHYKSLLKKEKIYITQFFLNNFYATSPPHSCVLRVVVQRRLNSYSSSFTEKIIRPYPLNFLRKVSYCQWEGTPTICVPALQHRTHCRGRTMLSVRMLPATATSPDDKKGCHVAFNETWWAT